MLQVVSLHRRAILGAVPVAALKQLRVNLQPQVLRHNLGVSAGLGDELSHRAHMLLHAIDCGPPIILGSIDVFDSIFDRHEVLVPLVFRHHERFTNDY